MTLCVTLLSGCKSLGQEETAFNGEEEEEKIEESEEEEKPQEEQPKEETPAEEQQETPSAEQPETEKPAPTPTPIPSPEEELENLYESGISSTAIGYNGKNTKSANYSVSKPISVKGGVSVSNIRPQGTVLSRLMEKKNQDFDYVVLHGGVNDAWSLAEVGVMQEGFDPEEFDPTTFAGGLELLIYNAIVIYGDTAAIGYLVNFKAPACGKGTVSDITAYNTVAMQICEKWGITYFDMYNHEEITRELKLDSLTHTDDYIHPNAFGYDILAPYIADYIRDMTPCTEEMLNKILGK